MGLFDKFVKNNVPPQAFNTSNFFLGAPEAEAESNANSRMRLGEAFEDYLEVLPNLSHEKFIITGRKGSGKSAIAEYIYLQCEADPMYFAEFVRKSDLNLEQVSQITHEFNSSKGLSRRP